MRVLWRTRDRFAIIPYLRLVRWDRLFEDLEDQLASEWEAERVALESESERLRLSKLTVRERLIALQRADVVAFGFADGTMLRGSICAVGGDFAAVRPERSGARGDAPLVVMPVDAIATIALAHADLLRSARGDHEPRSPLADRVTLGFVLRDAARRRRGVHVALSSGETLAGTIDRVGADHLDLALHDAGAPRRASEVTGFRLVPFAGLSWVRLDQVADHELP